MAQILLIQRERIFLNMHGRALVKAGYDVIGKDDIDSGRRALAAYRPSVVICAFHGWFGEEDLGDIRALRAMRPDVPIIVLCYRIESPPASDAMGSGASIVIQRELSSEQLIELVDRVCRWGDGRRSVETFSRPSGALVTVAT